jgi:hypothetical protein
MRPYNHLKDLNPGLIRFAVYLQSQNWKYQILSPDYDCNSGMIRPVNSQYNFLYTSEGLIRIERATWHRTVFHHMPVREEIFA